MYDDISKNIIEFFTVCVCVNLKNTKVCILCYEPCRISYYFLYKTRSPPPPPPLTLIQHPSRDPYPKQYKQTT